MVVLMLLSGCSMKNIALRTTADLMAAGAPAFEEENDLELAEQAMGGNLKVLEAFLKSDPNNEILLMLLAKSYGGYTFAFIEDAHDQWKSQKPELADQYKKRAGNFYLRGKEYAMRWLKKKNRDFEEALTQDFKSFEASLEDFDRDDTEILFWAAYNWGNWLNMNLHEPDAIAAAPKVERMMKKVLELDEYFYHAGPHLFYGVYYGGRPAMLGGDTKRAQTHFEKALAFTKRKFLITQVLYAQYYAVQTQNKALFKQLLNEVIDADEELLPEQNLITQLAKKKARRLLAQQGDLF